MGPSSGPTGLSPGPFLGPSRPPAALALAVVATILALLHGFLLRWVSDDAFITFRYVDQWLAGNGLVYNPGERVEGYTHPLWLWLLAATRALGMDMVPASWFWSLVAYGGCVALVARSYPMAALALAAHHEMAVWSTGGLETALFTLEATALLWMVARWANPSPWRPIAIGSLGAAMMLTRPDGVLFVVLAGGLLAVWARDLLSSRLSPSRRAATIGVLRWFLLPVVILLVPYLAWKLWYYGDLLPNTFYAKSGGGTYFTQGFYYLGTFFRGHPISALALIALVAGPLLMRARLTAGLHESVPGRSPAARPGTAEAMAVRAEAAREARTLVAAALFTAVYLVGFVARVGGDFMYGRFVVPVVPLLFIGLEVVVRALLGISAGRARRSWLVAVGLVVPLLVLAETPFTRDPLFADASRPDGRRRLRGIEDERWYWTHDVGTGESQLQRYARIGRRLGELLSGLDVTVSTLGQCSLAYYGRFPRVVEENGLTEPRIARKPLDRRSRPGHEKRATLDELRELGVDLRFFQAVPEDEPYRIVWFQIGPHVAGATGGTGGGGTGGTGGTGVTGRGDTGRAGDTRATGTGGAGDTGAVGVTGELLRYDESLLAVLVGRHPGEVRALSFPQYFDQWVEEEAHRLNSSEIAAAARGFEAYYFATNNDPVRRARLAEIVASSD